MAAMYKSLRGVSAARNTLCCVKHRVTVIPCCGATFFEQDKKGGYNTKEPMKLTDMLKEGFKILKPEFNKFKEEIVIKLRCDGFYSRYHQDFEYFERFNSQEALDSWVVTSDQDLLEGKSSVNLSLSRHNHALFSGNICTEVPKDGIVNKAGYCHLRSPKNMKSFQREEPYDWTRYTHLVLRVRGDGRPYLFTIGISTYYDVTWHDQYNFTLYTRGGPYWQTSKIPFSKFFMASKGRIQDKQEQIRLNKVSYFGLTQADGNDGPFQLEIDYVGLMFDENDNEEFAYESYEVTPFIVGT
ncbi:LOW QUALITY PROTEIN: complex I intermediate-associated protein 30, mitochondrial-like [Liolophura sinensis]|uniref:LOW QUALITY PROTEIN: complex I intermediate-associated protein 30, mitochondrial-like n=1 Tax=Liolophura sinensis TaxID=3198878 RepID=UPI0031587650